MNGIMQGVTCKACKQDFLMSEAIPNVSMIGDDDIVHVTFCCPYCDVDYYACLDFDSFLMDDEEPT